MEERAVGTGKSPVSRRFIAQTATALAELLARPLNEVDLVALIVDGVHFGEHTCLVALRIDITGVKHPLAIDTVSAIGSGTGRSKSTGGERTSGVQRVLESYIRVEREPEGTAAGQGDHERRMGLGAAAITLILEQEPKLKWTSQNNPGYDL